MNTKTKQSLRLAAIGAACVFSFTANAADQFTHALDHSQQLVQGKVTESDTVLGTAFLGNTYVRFTGGKVPTRGEIVIARGWRTDSGLFVASAFETIGTAGRKNQIHLDNDASGNNVVGNISSSDSQGVGAGGIQGVGAGGIQGVGAGGIQGVGAGGIQGVGAGGIQGVGAGGIQGVGAGGIQGVGAGGIQGVGAGGIQGVGAGGIQGVGAGGIQGVGAGGIQGVGAGG